MSVVTHNFDDVMARLLEKAKDFRQPMTDFYGYLLRRTQLTFSKLGRKGNTTPFREALWPWFAPQYTRKDGTVVPAEGGVAKVRGTGVVKGRKRRSGKRITVRSKMMQDRGVMKAAAISRFRLSTHEALMETPPAYADEQQKMRKFVFVTTDEVNHLRNLIIRHLVS